MGETPALLAAQQQRLVLCMLNIQANKVLGAWSGVGACGEGKTTAFGKNSRSKTCDVRAIEKRSTVSRATLAIWWPGAESNHRHKDFQSSALPTELPGQGAQV
jgi:hypothetical protein